MGSRLGVVQRRSLRGLHRASIFCAIAFFGIIGVQRDWTRKNNYLTNFSVCPLQSRWHNRIIIRHMCCFLHVVCFFFQFQLYHFVPILVQNVTNTCFAKPYYTKRLTHKNCNRVTTVTLLHSWLTNQLTLCSHVTLPPITTRVNYIFLPTNILYISLHIIE
jgi:hypothetical protein